MSQVDDTDLSTQAEAPSDQQQSNAPDTAPSGDVGQNAADAGADAAAVSAQPSQARQDQADPSLTTPKDVASNAPSQLEQVDPEAFKRLRDEKSQWGRQMADLKRNYEATRQQLAQMQQEHERAKQLADQQKLKLHDFRHPEHAAKFQPILQKADLIREQLQRINNAKLPDGISPEQGQIWKDQQKAAIYGSLSEQEQAALDDYAQYTQQFQRDLSLNPAKAIGSFVQPMFEQFWQQKMAEQHATMAVQQDMADPTLGPIFKEFAEPMQEMIQRLGGTDEAYEVAKHHARVYGQNRTLFDENARLKQQLAELGVKANAAEAQQQLAKGRASITKDVPARTNVDAYGEAKKWAKANGVDTGSPQFFAKIRELESSTRN